MGRSRRPAKAVVSDFSSETESGRPPFESAGTSAPPPRSTTPTSEQMPICEPPMSESKPIDSSARQDVSPRSLGHVDADQGVAAKAPKSQPSLPHVHVFGDLAELQLLRTHDKLPDQNDPSLTAYRKVRGFVQRALPGGAWSVAQSIRAALGDVWKCDTEWTEMVHILQAPAANDPDSAWRRLFKLDIYPSQDSQADLETAPAQSVVLLGQEYRVSETRHLDIETMYPALKELSPRSKGKFDVSYTSDDVAETWQYYRFDGGTTKASLEADPEVSKNKVRFRVDGDWPPSLTVFPLHDEVKAAIRHVKLNELLERVQGRLHPTAGSDPISSEKPNAEEYTVEQLWQHGLEPDESKPLETFLMLDRTTIDGERKPASRLVLILDSDWCRQEVDGESRSGLPAKYVGYLIIPADSDQWRVWSSKGNLELETERGPFDANFLRLQFDFPKPPEKGVGRLFGFPITPALARFFRPNERPAPAFPSPLAHVTTSQDRNATRIGQIDSEIIRPLWRAKLYDFDGKGGAGRSSGKTYRLENAEGYDWQPNWCVRVAQSFHQWNKVRPRKSHHDALPERYDLRMIEWGLSRSHRHGAYHPQWVPSDLLPQRDTLAGITDGLAPISTSTAGGSREFQHLVFVDLNFGFRRFDSKGFGPESETNFNEPSESHRCENRSLVEQFVEGRKETTHSSVDPSVQETHTSSPAETKTSEGKATKEPDSAQDEDVVDVPILPDWWIPLQRWSADNLRDRGWIVGILGRQLPLTDEDWCEGCDAWDSCDLWSLLRFAEIAEEDSAKKSVRPLFRDRTVVIVSGNLLRASGARISHRLSWEHTAVDCVRELQANTRLSPLLEFRHLIVRFGVSGALHVSRQEQRDGQAAHSGQFLFYDATARDGFYRDLSRLGHVVGANSVYAARVLQELLTFQKSLGSGRQDIGKEEEAIRKGVRQAINDCQVLYEAGYGANFKETDEFRVSYSTPEIVLFKPKP